MFHDDNAPSLRALVTRELPGRNSMATLSHPPYSPDLVPCDFFLFPKMKLQLKGRCFDTGEEIESQKVLGTLGNPDPERVPAVAMTPGALCRCTWRLLSRGWLLNKLKRKKRGNIKRKQYQHSSTGLRFAR